MSILCVGQLVADVVVRPVDALPSPGQAVSIEELKLIAGGCASNTACVLAKLGVATSIGGLVGRDSIGDVVLSDIAACGVDISTVCRDETIPTSAVIVLVGNDGERSFFYREGANEKLTADMISDDAVRKVDFVHIGGAMKLFNFDLASFLTRAKALGRTTSLDTDWDVSGNWFGALEHSLSKIDYLLTNEEEGKMITGKVDPIEIGQTLLAGGPKAVIVKRGPLGSIAVTAETVEEFPGFKVDAVDTTCAGDCFAAGFLFGMIEGWDIAKAVRFGNAAGALCTTQISHSGITSLPTVKEFLSSRTQV
jgi:sugar/nucleoside kinase (ribokinase family)